MMPLTLSKEWSKHLKELFTPKVKNVEINYDPSESFMTFDVRGNLYVSISQFHNVINEHREVDYELWQVADLYHEVGHYIHHSYAFGEDVHNGIEALRIGQKSWIKSEILKSGYNSYQRMAMMVVNIIDDVRIDYKNCKKFAGYLQANRERVDIFSEKIDKSKLRQPERRMMATVYNVIAFAEGKELKSYDLVSEEELKAIAEYMKMMVKIPAGEYKGKLKGELRKLYNTVVDFYLERLVEERVNSEDWDSVERAILKGKKQDVRETDLTSNLRLEEAGVSEEDFLNEISGNKNERVVNFPELEEELKSFFGGVKRIQGDTGRFSAQYYLRSKHTPTMKVFKKRERVNLQDKWLFLVDVSGSTQKAFYNEVNYLFEQEFLVVDAFMRYLPKNSVYELWEFSDDYWMVKKGSHTAVADAMWKEGSRGGGTYWSSELYEDLLKKEKAGYQVVILTDGAIELKERELLTFLTKQTKRPVIILFSDYYHKRNSWVGGLKLDKDFGVITSNFKELGIRGHIREVLKKWK